MFSMRVYVLVAAIIALAAFGFAQIYPGKGIFVVFAGNAWVAYCIHRQRKLTIRC